MVNSLIINQNNLAKKVNSLDFVLGVYHEWKKETKEFGKFLSEKIEEVSKDRTGDNLSDK